MDNSTQTNIEGSNNIIIQDIKESTITIDVNGNIQEIRNDLNELKKILQSIKVQTFQQGENIYNIAHIDQANFRFLTGKQVFNEWLVKNLIFAIKQYSADATSFIEFYQKESDWGKHEFTCARQIIVSAYVGLLGIQLRKLIAIGQESAQEKQKKYIENSIITANVALGLACFSLISGLWGSKQNFHPLTDKSIKQLESFFDKKMESELPIQLEFMFMLIEIFNQHHIPLPVPELLNLYTNDECNKELKTACFDLQSIMDKNNYDLLECYQAEKHVTKVLSCMSFWANYRMVSIKNISYEEIRNFPIMFLHNYVKVGYTFNENYQLESNLKQVNYIDKPIVTDAILLFKENYRQSINLSPFIIDLNALSMESDIKICLYCSRHYKNKNLLVYRFLENYNDEIVGYENILSDNQNVNKLMSDPVNRRKYKFDQVYLLFQQARKAILGSE